MMRWIAVVAVLAVFGGATLIVGATNAAMKRL